MYRNARECTRAIKNCLYFKDLLAIIQSNQAFDSIHISALFSRWSQLWKIAQVEVKNTKEEQEEWEKEIRFMESHLQGASFKHLIALAHDALFDISARSLCVIANALSSLPYCNESKTLMVALVAQANSFDSLEDCEEHLGLLANAMAQLCPREGNSLALIKKIACYVNSLVSLENFKEQGLANLMHAFAKMNWEDKVLYERLDREIMRFNGTSCLEGIRQVYHFYCYAQTKRLLQKEPHYLESLHKKIINLTVVDKPSKFQSQVSALVAQILQKNYPMAILKEEEFIAGHPVDITIRIAGAAFGVQIALEIDGPFHYREGQLDNTSDFRTELLSHAGWYVVRLPYFELNPIMHDRRKFEDYLMEKLAPIISLQAVQQPVEEEKVAIAAPILEQNLSPENINQHIESCSLFDNYLRILNQVTNKNISFNPGQLVLLLSQWAKLWTRSLHLVLEQHLQKQCEQEIVHMTYHIQGKSFCNLLQILHKNKALFSPVELKGIQEALDQLPKTPESSSLKLSLRNDAVLY